MIETIHITVVVPTFNRENLLRQTLASLKQQNFSSSEFLIVDDGSNASTFAVITEFTDSDRRFRLIEKPSTLPRGPQASRNLGLRHAVADYIMFLDSDDLLSPTCLQTRWDAIKNSDNADIHVFPQVMFQEGGKMAEDLKLVNVVNGENELDRFLAFAWPVDIPWINGAVLIRIQSLRSTGIQWLEQFFWDDLVFHFQCIATGLSVSWHSNSAADCFYRLLVQEEHQGQKLHTQPGVMNTAEMCVWILDRMCETKTLTGQRRKRLAISFFHAVVLTAVDLRFSLLTMLMSGRVRLNRIVNNEESIRICLYVLTRYLLRPTPRGTYFWNRFCRKVLLRDFFKEHEVTYASIPPKNISWIPSNGYVCCNSQS